MLKILLVALTVISFIFGNVGNVDARAKKNTKSNKSEVVNIIPRHKHNKNCKETTAEPVQIICILDRSGSMHELEEDTIGGYNSFLEKQKENSGAAEVTTVLFDDRYEIISDAIDIQEVPELTPETYYARGRTALFDTVGTVISDILGRMEKEKICPAKRRVLVMIMTDGKENASTEYNKSAIKSLIGETSENYEWNYIFMGANIDAMKEATSIGISGKRAMNFAATGGGIARTFDKMSEAATEMRENGSVSDDWKD